MQPGRQQRRSTTLRQERADIDAGIPRYTLAFSIFLCYIATKRGDTQVKVQGGALCEAWGKGVLCALAELTVEVTQSPLQRKRSTSTRGVWFLAKPQPRQNPRRSSCFQLTIFIRMETQC